MQGLLYADSAFSEHPKKFHDEMFKLGIVEYFCVIFFIEHKFK
jgi:hypothetical protein